MTDDAGHTALYDDPALYEAAFGFRPVADQCDFLSAVHQMAAGREPYAICELACGPGEHVREFARRGLPVAAVDRSVAMIAHLRERLGDMTAELVTADMTDFRLGWPVELAFTLFDTLGYLTTNDRLIAHLRAVSAALQPGGVYVIEVAHPRNLWCRGDAPRLANTWRTERDVTRVSVEWGIEEIADPVAQTHRVKSRVTEERDGTRRVVDSWGEVRAWLPQELRAMADLAGGWRFVGWWGDFDLGVPLGNTARDRCLIAAFQKAPKRKIPVIDPHGAP